jgi:hypothetical protein
VWGKRFGLKRNREERVAFLYRHELGTQKLGSLRCLSTNSGAEDWDEGFIHGGIGCRAYR